MKFKYLFNLKLLKITFNYLKIILKMRLIFDTIFIVDNKRKGTE